MTARQPLAVLAKAAEIHVLRTRARVGGGRGRVVAEHRGEPARQLPVCPGRAAGNARPPAGADHQHGLRPSPFSSAYSCAKAALLRLTDSIAAATRGHGVSVFAVSPGNVQTAMMDYLTDSEAGRRWLGGREREFQPPERVAALCVQLASGRVDRLSGRYIHVTHDLANMMERAEEIERDDLYALRLRTLPPRA